jgi:hypothetical protein
MAGYRLTHAAQADIISILAWSDEQFGEEARKRYETLIATAIRGGVLIIGRVLHDAMDPLRHVGAERPWG